MMRKLPVVDPGRADHISQVYQNRMGLVKVRGVAEVAVAASAAYLVDDFRIVVDVRAKSPIG